MKRMLFFVAFSGLSVFCVSCGGPAYVREPPVYVERVRPVAPYPNYVWIDGDWAWRGNAYVRNEGFWAAPRPNRRFEAGHWEKSNRGYRWEKGHWR